MKNTLSAIGHFLSTLVMPRRMKQYSRMNLFISFLIFVALSYLVIAPDIIRINHEYKTEAPELLERTTGVIPLRNNQDTSIIPDFPTKCEISSNALKCSFDYTYSKFALYYDTTEGEATFHNKVTLVFDPRDLASIEESRYDVAYYHTGVQTEADQHQLLFVFTGKELYFYPVKDPNYTYANDQAIVVPYTDAVTEITTKTTSKDLTSFLASLVSQAVTDQSILKPLTDNQSTEAVDSIPTKATLTAGQLSVEFDYTYAEVPFSFATTEGEVTYKNNVLLVFDLFDAARRTIGRFDFFEYHRSHPTKTNERDYLFVFQPSTVIYYSEKDPNYGTAQASPMVYRYIYYSQTGMDFSTFPNNAKGLTGYLSENLITNQVLTERQIFTTVSFVTTVLLPLVMIFLFYLVFHRGGVLKKFKEYYNVAAISFIPTSLIIFLACFVINYYKGMLFYFSFQILFYVFCLFRINVDFNAMKSDGNGAGSIKPKQVLEATFETIPEENHRSSDMTASAYNPAKKNK